MHYGDRVCLCMTIVSVVVVAGKKIRTTRFVVFQRTLPALDCQVVRVFELPMSRRRRCVVSPVHFVSLLVTSFHLPSSLSYPFGIVLNSRFVLYPRSAPRYLDSSWQPESRLMPAYQCQIMGQLSIGRTLERGTGRGAQTRARIVFQFGELIFHFPYDDDDLQDNSDYPGHF